uniref:RNA helicase n=1 Tax=Zooxanthella nutricula TaxID=1333877 RepID=A0A7S2LLU3_9DINO
MGSLAEGARRATRCRSRKLATLRAMGCRRSRCVPRVLRRRFVYVAARKASDVEPSRKRQRLQEPPATGQCRPAERASANGVAQHAGDVRQASVVAGAAEDKRAKVDRAVAVGRLRKTETTFSVSAASPPAAGIAHDQQVKCELAVDVREARAKLRVLIEDDPFGDCPAPVSSFEALGALPEYALRSLRRHGIESPMPIQAQALPLVLKGRDVIGLAQTGSGKTLAFLLPAAVRIERRLTQSSPRSAATQALVLAPTRELAVQIADEATKIFSDSPVWVACVYGGGDRRTQEKRLSQGAHIVAATPGRLIDFANTGAAQLDVVSYFVLDEADRMLDLGFHDDVVGIAARLRPKRQTLFFSATWGGEVQDLARSLCAGDRRPVRISYAQQGCRGGFGGATAAAAGAAGTGGEAKQRAREDIVQEVVVVDSPGQGHWERQETIKNERLDLHLREVLGASADHQVLVFVSQKALADKVSRKLWQDGFQADAMHGGKSQENRLWVLDQFRKGKLRLLVCTDVLGRGIDIPSVSHVVIHEMGEIEDYVHRIGRTARGKHGKGHALVFFEFWEGAPHLAADLAAVLEASKQHVPEDLRRIAGEVASGRRAVRR